LAILSRLGVRPAIKPRWYAPMFHMPISSPMIKTMLGFLSCAWAGATALKSAAVAISNDKPLCIKFRFILGFLLFGFGFVLMIFPRSCRPLYLLRRSGRP